MSATDGRVPGAGDAAEVPAEALPASGAQAVDALRSATARPAETEAAITIVKAPIEGILDQALSRR